MSDRNKSSKDAAKDRAESSNKGTQKILQELEEGEELEETIIPDGGRPAPQWSEIEKRGSKSFSELKDRKSVV